jgi:hypothetical protein
LIVNRLAAMWRNGQFIIPDARIAGGVTLITCCLAVLFMDALKATRDRPL